MILITLIIILIVIIVIVKVIVILTGHQDVPENAGPAEVQRAGSRRSATQAHSTDVGNKQNIHNNM